MRFRKKLVEIEAIRFDDADETIGALVDFVAKRGGKFRVQTETDGVRRWRVVVIETLEGSMRTEPGDWIIRGVKGEFYPCKPDIFFWTYEPVEG